MVAFAKPAIVAALITAGGVWIGVAPDAHDSAPRQAMHMQARPRLDATSDAQARQMRGAVNALARQTGAGARCNPNEPSARYRPCVVPALRHAGIGGRMGATVLNVVIGRVPFGACREYLLGLRPALEGAGQDARWLLPQLYEAGRRRAQHEVSTQIELIVRMLHHAATAASADVCSPGADAPAL